MVFVYCLVSCFTGPGFQHAGLPYHHAFSPMLLFKGSDQRETRGVRKVANARKWSRTVVIDALFSFNLAAIVD
jgi:hypothetical protein